MRQIENNVVELPAELALECLLRVPGSHANFVISTACRAFQSATVDDAIWLGRLRRDFPRTSLRGKAPGSLRNTYKILLKAHRVQIDKALLTDVAVSEDSSELWWRRMASRPAPVVSDPKFASHSASMNPETSTAICDRLSSLLNLTAAQKEHHVRQVRASRREDPHLVAAALVASGGDVASRIAAMQGSERCAFPNFSASTFESVGTGGLRPSHRQRVTRAEYDRADMGQRTVAETAAILQHQRGRFLTSAA